MTDQSSIFESESTQTPAATETAQAQEPVQTVDAYADLLATIKSADGRQKYTDVMTALKSLPHANDHISRLEVEMEELRAEVARRQSAEDVLNRLESKTPERTEQPSGNTVDLAQIEKLVDSRLTARQLAEVHAANLKSVTGKVAEVYGDKAEAMFYSTAKEAGLSMQQINELAATAPAAVLKLMGVQGKVSNLPPKTTSSFNTEAFNMNSQDKPSAKVKFGASSKDMVSAWHNAKPTNQ